MKDAKEYIEKRRITSENGCWIWKQGNDRDGYARGLFNGKDWRISRLSYETYIGIIPKNMVVKTTCGNRFCINPHHLKLFHRVQFSDVPKANNFELQEHILHNIKRNYKSCWIWQKSQHVYGYGRTSFKGECHDVHRLSWIAFKGDIPSGLYVCHSKTCSPSCCNPDHMYLGSQKDNMADTKSLNNHQYGSRHNKAKLHESDVLKIRILRKEGHKFLDIAKEFNVSVNTIERIIYGKGWTHVL
jgi:hypothetical protein